MPVVRLGPGTITVGETPLDFSAEVRAAAVTHTYDESEEAVTYLDGSTAPATQVRTDGLTFSVDNSLDAQSLYAYCQENDLTAQPVVFTPNTAAGASWTGVAQVQLPESIGADAFGNRIASEVAWDSSGNTVLYAVWFLSEMASAGVQVQGAAELRRSMKRAGIELEDLKEAHSRIAAYVAEKATAKTPHRTGALKGTVRGNRAAATSTVSAGRASVPYARVIHWGWPQRNISAQPWISDAAQDSEDQVLSMFMTGIDAVIRTIEGA